MTWGINSINEKSYFSSYLEVFCTRWEGARKLPVTWGINGINEFFYFSSYPEEVRTRWECARKLLVI